MAINSYDDNKITKGGIWVTIIMSCKPHVRARLNSIFVACGSLLVYPFDVFSRMLARKTQIIFSSKIKGSPQRLSPPRSALQWPNAICGHSLVLVIPWIWVIRSSTTKNKCPSDTWVGGKGRRESNSLPGNSGHPWQQAIEISLKG